MFFVSKLKLINFRCFSKVEISFSKKINILLGVNAVGKTTIAEGVYMLGCCKSHRTNNDFEIVRKGEEFYSIISNVVLDDVEEEIKVLCTNKGKKILKNDKVYRNLSDYVGYFNVVLFCPEDLRMIKGDPSSRRRFLDLFISQVDREYLIALMKYKKILKQRNEYLKSDEDKMDYILLETLTNGLINEAKTIISKRKEYVEKLNQYFNSEIDVISGNQECGKLVYKMNVDVDKIDEEFEKKRKAELLLQTTMVGPHKDDLEILINGEKSSAFASQGQQRTLALALKLSQARVIKEKSNNVIIILDDVFGELDKERQNNLIKLLTFDSQIIITTTTIENLSEEVLKKSKIIDINKDGGINE